MAIFLLVNNKDRKFRYTKKNLYIIIFPRAIVLQGGLTRYSDRMEVTPMKNHFDFMDMLTFGIFLLALLTFVFTFCK